MIRHNGDSKAMTGHLTEVIIALSKHHVRFIICGGWAVVMQGVRRMTMDLDLSVDMDPDNLRRFLEALKELNLTPRAPIPAESILDEKLRQFIVREKNAAVFSFVDSNNPYRQVDVMLTDEGAYDRLILESEVVRIGGYPVRIVSKKGLIHMKEQLRHVREKDLQDIRELRRLSSSENGQAEHT